MTLRKLIVSRPDTPYFRPPPLQIRVLKMGDQVRVITFDVKEGVAKPLITKYNKLAAITDGEMIIKTTIFEFSSKVHEEVSYVMRGHEVRGIASPYVINVTARRQFFRPPVLPVAESLFA